MNLTPAKEVITYHCFYAAVTNALCKKYRGHGDLIREKANRERLVLMFDAGESVEMAVDSLSFMIQANLNEAGERIL